MAYFSYRAIDAESRIIKGRVEASNEDDLEDRLNSEGLTLIEATKRTFSFSAKPSLKEKDLLNFSYFLNVIISSGMSIMSGLNDMAKQSLNKRVSLAASYIQAKLESGKSISDSMLEYPKLFPPYYTSMIRAGEASGNMEQVLNDLMNYIEWQMKLKKDVRSALSYPAVVLTSVVLLIVILFTFVMPKLLGMFTQLNVSMPLPTKILVATVDFVTVYWPLIILFLIALPVIYKLTYNTMAGKRAIDISILRIPLIGELVKKLNHSRYFRTFATLYRSGLTMEETLRLSSGVIKNSIISESLTVVTNSVLGGEQLSKALRNSGSFGPLLVNMVEIGEKTGTLDNTIIRICDMYDREIPETIKKIFFILEPVLIILLGGLVLLTLASFFLGYYRLIGGIR